MSTNKINIEAVNARAKEAQTPMTKIPSVEERFVANYLDGDKIQDGQMLSSRECLDAITAEREAGAREYRQFILNVLDGTDIADGECNTKAIRFAIASRIIK